MRRRFRLNYYGDEELSAGQLARLTLRLKPPVGTRSLGAFDYGRWLIANGYAGRGYVKHIAPAGVGVLPVAEKIRAEYSRIRSAILEGAAVALADYPQQGVIRALVFADRRGVSDRQWQWLSLTGTSHLMAISGMHIGIVMAWGFWFARVLVLPLSRGGRRAIAFAPTLGLCVALIYAALAGFTLPTQRALIMAGVLALGFSSQRHISPWQAWWLALVLVLLRDPLVVHNVGFFLSFAAVAILLAGGAQRPVSASRLRALVVQQGRLLLALAPLLLMWGFGAGVASLPANLLAIPVLALVVMPLLFVGSLVMAFGGEGAAPFSLADWLLSKLFAALEYLSVLPFWQPGLSPESILCLCLAAALLLLPPGLLIRPLALIFIVLALLPQPRGPAPGELWVSVLDVGQGLSVLLQYEKRAMIYDTGPSLSPRFNSADAVLLPLLKRRGIKELDALVLSHGDRDHAGAAEQLLARLPVLRVLSGEPERHRRFGAQNCHGAAAWRWGELELAFLGGGGAGHNNSNNRSCVLLLSLSGRQVLLAGDIERKVEAGLAASWPPSRHVDLLQVAHHGSKSSSSLGFLRAIRPDQVVFAAGRFNPYGHPAPSVVSRFAQLGSRCWHTGIHGSLHFSVTERGVRVRDYNGRRRFFWQTEPWDMCTRVDSSH